jgi:hypothetical protein
MIRWMLTAVAVAASGLALAKLPPPDEATKAKAAEAAAKTAWQGKVDAYLTCKAQDKVVAAYKRTSSGKIATSTPAASAPSGGAVAGTPAATAAAPAAATPPAAAMPTPTPATASQGGATPVAAASPTVAPMPACADPGPFAYAPPEQKPLETSGAHSPAANATSPPSVRTPSGDMTSGKTGAPVPGATAAAAATPTPAAMPAAPAAKK